MKKLLIKAAVILLLSEAAVMVFLWYSGIAHRPIGIILDPLLMALVALVPIYFLLRAERRAMARRELLDSKLNRIVDGLWSASLHTLSETELLATILKEILENSPFSTVHKGAIFLTEGDRLVLKTQEGFGEEQKRICGEVEPGRCLCGKALETGESIFASMVDGRHDNEFPGMAPHGHYCFPIKSAGSVIGVLNLYLEAGHARDAAEERFLASVCAIIARILEGKKLERSLFRMQKTEALNRFAAGIAHDLNNILGAIRGFSDVAARCLPPDSETSSDMKEISAAVDRGADLTRRLRLFARQETETPEVFDLNLTVDGLGGILRRVMSGVSVELRLAGGPLRVKAVRGQLEQGVMNLAANARDAMPDGGELLIRTAEAPCPKRLLSAGAPASCAMIEVRDTGRGMTAEQARRAIEPFYTTKTRGKGTGLGLSIVYGMIKQHGGEIEISSEPDKGTSVRIYIPLSGKPAAALPERTAAAGASGGIRVLMIEDYHELRAVASKALRAAGFEVSPAGRLDEALLMFEEAKGAYDLIFADIVLPDGKSPDAVEKFRAVNPRVKFVFTTGYLENQDLLALVEKGGHSFMEKPYSIEKAAATLKGAARGSAAA